MTKSFYSFVNNFLGLAIVANLFEGFMFLLLNTQLYTLDSFIGWLLVVSCIAGVSQVSILIYYYHKKYWLSFVTGAMAAAASFSQLMLTYLIFTRRVDATYYIPLLFLMLLTGMLHALSLVFSKAGERRFLKIAGIVAFIILLIQLSLLTVYLQSGDSGLKANLDSCQQWISLAAALVPILFILNFLTEAKCIKAIDDDKAKPDPVQPAMTLLVLSAIVLTFTLGIWLIAERSKMLYWQEQNFKETLAWSQPFQQYTFIGTKGDTLRYRLLKPLHYDPHQKYPLVVSLPYGGQPGTDTIRQIEGAAAAQVLSADSLRSKYPAFIFVPNRPVGKGWGGMPDVPAVDTLFFEALAGLQQHEPAIDAKRRYITGVSRGGFGAWHLVGVRPEMFAAAIPVSSGGDPGYAPNMAGVAVWAFHGENDVNAPVSGSRNMIAAIKKAGGHPLYTEYKGEGHDVWQKVIQTPGLWDWLFAQKRN